MLGFTDVFVTKKDFQRQVSSSEVWDLANFLEKSFPLGVVVVTEYEPVADAIAEGAVVACGWDGRI